MSDKGVDVLAEFIKTKVLRSNRYTGTGSIRVCTTYTKYTEISSIKDGRLKRAMDLLHTCIWNALIGVCAFNVYTR